ncbi:MAG: ABC transporter permease [Deltaproteobacteria bacterium]|uniref:Transport permease protein n=1 Tax=Candidatus Zymogenus saltonus TaxID=2844893 RepID=A0A9D8KDI3_9DELT|nr:ABC transporter permease [Candidatus Zymogenus saltonus]
MFRAINGAFAERIKYILKKELTQIFRDKRMRAIIFIPPILQLIVLGYAASTDVRHISTAVLDADRTEISRQFIKEFDSGIYFDVTHYLSSPKEADPLIDRGEVSTFIYIKKGFGESIKAGKSAGALIIVDGTDSSTASVVLNYVNRIVASYLDKMLKEKSAMLRGMTTEDGAPIMFSTVSLDERTWYNEDLKSRNFYIPGIFGLLLVLIGVMLTSMAIVKEREVGTLEQIIVTPIRSYELIIGKLLPFTIIGYIDVVLILLVAVFWFRVPFEGSVIFLFGATAFFLLPALGIGLFISTISATQQEAMMSTFLFLFPAMMLSGFVFPIESMPWIIRVLTYLNPLRYMMTILRGIFLKGTGPAEHMFDLLGLLLLGILVIGLSSVRFTKRMK